LNANNLAIRISSTEYGDDAKITIDNTAGSFFQNERGAYIVAGQTATDYGQSAIVNVNGQNIKVPPNFRLAFTSDAIRVDIQLSMGILGMTTIAVQGYTEGAFASRAGSLKADADQAYDRTTGGGNYGSYATQARNNTETVLSNLEHGCQLQLSESGAYYERTVLGLRNMNTDMVGLTEITGFDEVKKWTKTLSLSDMRSGCGAALSTDPTAALAIIEQAINDVSSTRGQIGATQSTMLQTNMNNLSIMIENIQKTESYIRDADMATEVTEFTKNQTLQNAAMSMLAQANAQSQATLSLLAF
jgi:flagellin-like hook-associated protein FlgL